MNAGLEGGVIVEKVRGLKGANGLNAATGEYEDLFKTGVIDAAKVTVLPCRTRRRSRRCSSRPRRYCGQARGRPRRPCRGGNGRLLDRPVLCWSRMGLSPGCHDAATARGDTGDCLTPNRGEFMDAPGRKAGRICRPMSARVGCLPYTDDVPLIPTTGWGVLHLFCRLTPDFDPDALRKAVKQAEADGYQVVPVALLGHKGTWAHGARARRVAAPPPADRRGRLRRGHHRVLRVADRGLRVRRRCPRGATARPGSSPHSHPRARTPSASTR